jgi:hypothetical protein
MDGITYEEDTEQESNDNESKTEAFRILSLDLFFRGIVVCDGAILLVCGRIF